MSDELSGCISDGNLYCTIQAGSATVAPRPPTNLHDLVVVMRQSQGVGGGTLIFSSYVGSGSASTVHPLPQKNKTKKTQKPGISRSPKNI